MKNDKTTERKTIWKYEIPITGRFYLDMPRGASPLAFQLQGNTPTMWAAVYPDAPMHKREFHIVGTGGEMIVPFSKNQHVGTIQMDEFVWHLFAL